ncbi:MAG: Mrp/NBP35 family ATP-binding protein [Planctomycetes bacterium]|nr:Mrp/NBP35 family ATP-binding protein [Planctomycetota bacterium]
MATGSVNLIDVEKALADFKDPETGRSALQLEQIRDIEVSENKATLTLALTTHSAPLRQDVKEALSYQLRNKLPTLTAVDVNLAEHHRPPQKLGEVGLTAKSVIAVGSGKGGVGKSTIATCLAYGLKRAGCVVGLMDADVYGPSVPHLTGTRGTPDDIQGEGKLRPIKSEGIPIMSIGYFVPEDQAMIWRGPMLHQAVLQFLRDVDWGELDYLIIDMPPGTGDVALTLSQALPLTGAVIVCTPQDVALLDAVKAINMFGKVNIPILGVVENMSGFVCPNCNKRHDIFGRGGARRRAEQLNVPFLGEVPININVRINGDAGQTQLNFEDPASAHYFEQIVYQLSKHLADRASEKPPMPTLPVLG